MSNWYNNEEYATIEIASLVGDVYFDKQENLSASFIIQILTPQEPITNKVIKTQQPAPQVNEIKSLGAKLESRPYKSSNAMTLVIPASILPQFMVKPESEEEGIYVIPTGTKFIIGTMGGDIAEQDIRIIAAYTSGDEALRDVSEGAGMGRGGANIMTRNNGEVQLRQKNA